MEQAQSRQAEQGEEVKVTELLRRGQVAFIKGQRYRAHHLWRKAAMIRPYDEQVWISLLSVLESDDDRRACLQNIVTINPRNNWAAQQLAGLEPVSTFHDHTTAPDEIRPLKPRFVWPLGVLILAVLKYFILGLLIGIAVSIILYQL